MRTDEPPWGFRPWAEAAERLDYARTLGLKRGEVVNQVLEKHLHEIDEIIDARKQELKKLIAAPARN